MKFTSQKQIAVFIIVLIGIPLVNIARGGTGPKNIKIITPTTITYNTSAAVCTATDVGGSVTLNVLDQTGVAIASKPMVLYENFPAGQAKYHCSAGGPYFEGIAHATGHIASSGPTTGTGTITDTPIDITDLATMIANIKSINTTYTTTVTSVTRLIAPHSYYIQYNYSTWQQNTASFSNATQVLLANVSYTGTTPSFAPAGTVAPACSTPMTSP